MSVVARPGVIAASRRRSAGVAGTGYSAAVLADSPLLYLRFEEASGAACANDGSLGGSATAAGTYTRNVATSLAGVGAGILLDGVSGVVTYPDDPALDIVGDFTYECWVNPTDLSTSTFVMSKGTNAGATLGGYENMIRSGGGFFRVFCHAGVVFTTASGGVSTGVWSHVVLTRSGSTFTIYVNGSSTGTASLATAADATTCAFTIGARPVESGANSSFYKGSIADVAVYNTALSSTRVTAHYAARSS